MRRFPECSYLLVRPVELHQLGRVLADGDLGADQLLHQRVTEVVRVLLDDLDLQGKGGGELQSNGLPFLASKAAMAPSEWMSSCHSASNGSFLQAHGECQAQGG